MKKIVWALLVALPVVVLACGDGGDGDGSSAAEWGYDGSIGPDYWADLDPSYATCGDGLEQSPIDVPGDVAPAVLPALVVDYHETPLVIFNNGHTVEVQYEEGSTLSVEQSTWEVEQFHFHAHSEHTVAGVAAPLEMHIVHEDDEGGLAVVGVLIVEGADNPALQTVFDYLPAEQGDPEEIEGVDVNVADLLPQDLAAWRYDGSLTTPPCSEGVRWHVLATPIEASAGQIDSFEAIFDHNYRPVQPLGAREINN